MTRHVTDPALHPHTHATFSGMQSALRARIAIFVNLLKISPMDVVVAKTALSSNISVMLAPHCGGFSGRDERGVHSLDNMYKGRGEGGLEYLSFGMKVVYTRLMFASSPL